MKGTIGLSLVSITAAMTLVACASKDVVKPTAAVTAAGDDELAAEYRSLIDNAMGRTVCREQNVTGSRIHTHEVCVTRTQLDGERERTLELLDDARKATTDSGR
jgi:hypothetical protein